MTKPIIIEYPNKTESPGSKLLRLDQFIAEQLPYLSRAQIQKLIEDKQILVDKKATKSSYRLHPGEQIEINIPPPIASHIEGEPIALDIIYEDEHLAVVNKPIGMVTHPGAGVHSGTLVHALMHHMQGSLSGIGGVLRPGIVHRLDKDTSGLLVVAKSDPVHQHLSKQIQSKQAQRIYLAVLEGELPKATGSISAPIGRHPRRRTEMAIMQNGRAADTAYKILAYADKSVANAYKLLPDTDKSVANARNLLPDTDKSVANACNLLPDAGKPLPGNISAKYSLVELSLKTGRTHQIRVHMASLNCPVVGDIIYNRKKTGTLAARKKFELAGHALHAYKLSFIHPVSNELLVFSAPPPDDFKKLAARLFNREL